MKPVLPACLVAIACCAAPWIAAAQEFDPVARDGALDAVRRNEAREAPACRVDRPDALADGRLHIRPGETLCLALRLRDGRLEPVALVDTAGAADALVASARLEGGRTMLTLVNPLAQRLRYQAWLRRQGSDRLAYTSSCAVLSGHRMAFEDWPFAVDELVLAGFELEPEFEADGRTPRVMECR